MIRYLKPLQPLIVNTIKKYLLSCLTVVVAPSSAIVFLYAYPSVAPHTFAKGDQSPLLYILLWQPWSLQTAYQVFLVVVSPGR